MYTLGYSFQPWTEAKAIADGAVDPDLHPRDRARARHRPPDPLRPSRRARRVVDADARWTVEVERGPTGEPHVAHLQLPVHVRRLLRLRRGLHAGVPRHRALQGPHRPSAEMARRPRLRRQARGRDRQRRHGGDAGAGDGRRRPRTSPCCSARRPRWCRGPPRTPIANKLRRRLPIKLAYALGAGRTCCWACISTSCASASRTRSRSLLLGGVRQMLGPDYDVDTHFTPRYNPWDQRLCLVPDGDLFRAIRAARRRSSPTTSRPSPRPASSCRSGAELEADLVVTATGLVLVPLGGAKLTVDGRAVDPAKT